MLKNLVLMAVDRDELFLAGCTSADGPILVGVIG
jgi:hypothetical protein